MFRKPITALKKFFKIKPQKETVKLQVKEKSLADREHELRIEKRRIADWWKVQVKTKYQRLRIKRWRAARKMALLSRREQRV